MTEVRLTPRTATVRVNTDRRARSVVGSCLSREWVLQSVFGAAVFEEIRTVATPDVVRLAYVCCAEDEVPDWFVADEATARSEPSEK